jgi:hypothetical protein
MSATPSRWRTRTFAAVFAGVAVPWVLFVGYVAWNNFGATLGWVGDRNVALQELLCPLLVLAWFAFLVAGIGGAAALAVYAAGGRHLWTDLWTVVPGQTHGQHAAWRRPDRS